MLFSPTASNCWWTSFVHDSFYSHELIYSKKKKKSRFNSNKNVQNDMRFLRTYFDIWTFHEENVDPGRVESYPFVSWTREDISIIVIEE